MSKYLKVHINREQRIKNQKYKLSNKTVIAAHRLRLYFVLQTCAEGSGLVQRTYRFQQLGMRVDDQRERFLQARQFDKTVG